MSAYVQRFRGNAIQTGKSWSWELMISIGPVGLDCPEPLVIASKETFLNRDSALSNMKELLPGIMKTTCQAMGLPEPEGVHDLNAGVMESVEEWRKRK